MSYSEHWCREFLTRHPEYERQPQVLQQEPVAPSPSSLAAPFPWPSIANTAPPTPSSFVLPLSGFHTAKSGSSEQFPQQGPKTRHDAIAGPIDVFGHHEASMLSTPTTEANPEGSRHAARDQSSHSAGLGTGATTAKRTWQSLTAAVD